MEEEDGKIYIFSGGRFGLREDGTGALWAGSREAGVYEFEGTERGAAEGRAGAGGVGFLISGGRGMAFKRLAVRL